MADKAVLEKLEAFSYKVKSNRALRADVDALHELVKKGANSNEVSEKFKAIADAVKHNTALVADVAELQEFVAKGGANAPKPDSKPEPKPQPPQP